MQRKKVVTIGGGTGSFMLLSGLKKYPVDISAIVSMADDGGSTGVLRDELGVLPPGDVRQCLVALSDSSKALRELMNYRFEDGGLKGHNFGNLFLSALEKINGNFDKGVQEAEKILNIKGRVIPVTNDDARLFMLLKNGKILKGEISIGLNIEMQRIGLDKIYLSSNVRANPMAIKAIKEADVVVLGPGNYYCSIVPNLLVKGIADALKKTNAKIIYNCNLTNKKGQTDGFTLDDYAHDINKYIGKNRIDFVTYNTKKPTKNLVEEYEKQRELLVRFVRDKISNRSYRVVRGDMLAGKKIKYAKSDVLAAQRSFIRHDSDKLAKVLMMILELGEYENIIKEIV
ncbi:MAG: hypothetical protein US25_C0011G0010 [Candidatus Moranbacteria bacterium GW2011_GWE1_36_7]|nr:MAG: hypothetical protein UR99_C0020G0009 [Candidatus Moranbacteria bacterium GW2011_GWD2_36_12]KKQ06144.1 MAG: hypothetical protein US16_C0023G0009 [Candidatus Moranbacteria bacterium GW2011_GWE2_36_40]KKQ15150.1 MAG: hypothetical protein US25_C0011G0010 [Candidatus Moranbacteria bacterium GW2011_GWE1_36_7]